MEIDKIVEDFEFLDDWEDRYKYLIELGNALEKLPDADHNSANKVSGCVSQVWIKSASRGGDDPILDFYGDSDAHIVRGLIAVTLSIFSGKQASAIAATQEMDYFNQIGLQEHITPQRSNGLKSMVQRIRDIAKHEATATL